MSRPASPRGLIGGLGTDAASLGNLPMSMPLAIFEAEEGSMALTDYDQIRTPIKPEDDTEPQRRVRLKFAEIAETVLCPICLDILDNTMTAKQCLHRFCGECISKALRLGKKECPTCRMPCPSRRSLRQDEAFDKLIDVVFPDRTVLQKYNEEVMARLRQTTNMNALAESVKFGMKDQAANRAKRARVYVSDEIQVSVSNPSQGFRSVRPSSHSHSSAPHAPAPATAAHNVAEDASASASAAHVKQPPMAPPIEFTILPSPFPEHYQLPALEKPHLTITRGATLVHVTLYLFQTLQEQDPDFANLNLETAHMSFFIEQTGAGIVVQGPRKKLETVATHFRQTDAGRPLIIYYATKENWRPPVSSDAGETADRKASHKRAATEGAEAASEAGASS